MASEEFTVLHPTDLTVEDKWNILYNYLDFNARLMSLNALIHRDDKKAYYEFVSASAALKSIRDIMTDDASFTKAVAEMQDPKNEIVRKFPIPYDT